MKKSLRNATVEELIKLAESPTNADTEIYNYPSDILQFLSEYNIKSGEERVPNSFLYRLYKKWSENPLSQRSFSNHLVDIFQFTRYGPYYAMHINKSAITLKEEAYKYLKRVDKTKSSKTSAHFKKYLEKYSIKKGGLFIKDTVLYSLYDKWCGTRYKDRHPLSLFQFNNFCKVFFEKKSIKGHYWFALDYTILNHLSEDLIKEMKR